MAKRKKRTMPVMILWDRRQQRRFVEAVEKLVSFTNDLETLLGAKKRRSAAASKANETRKRQPEFDVGPIIDAALVANGSKGGDIK